MTLSFHPVRDDVPELSLEAWERLGGDDAERARFNRGVLLASADAMDAEFSVACLRDGARLRALAAVMVDPNAIGKTPLMSLVVPGSLEGGRHGRGLWVAPDERDVVGALRLLLDGVKAHARSRGVRLVVPFCAPDDAALREAAVALGACVLDTAAEYRLELPPGDTFERYLSRLNAKRRNQIKRDLRRAERAGASVVVEHPASEATLRRCRQLELEHARRHREILPRGDENLLLRLRRRLPPEQTGVWLCVRGPALLGFLFFHRVARTSQWISVGHADDADLQVFVSLVPHYISREIADGVRVLLFGSEEVGYKERLGFAPCARVHYYFATP